MNKHGSSQGLRLTGLMTALLAAFSAVAAEDADEITVLSRPESRVQLGLGYVDQASGRYGMYTGRPDAASYGLFDAEVVHRDDATGTWLVVRGRNLGLDNRELRLSHVRQGDWGYFVEHNEITRHNPYTINTGLQGIGTDRLTVSPNNKRNVQLQLKREKTSLGYNQFFGAGFEAQVRFSQEEKDGTRMFGRGTTGGSGNFNFLAEPANTTTRQVDAALGYSGAGLQLQAGYYGSIFENHYPSLTVAGGGNCFNGVPLAGACAVPGLAFSTLALPPGNEAHQVFLTGSYDFTRATRGTFKASHSKTTQTEAFVRTPGGANISGRTDLGGEVDTALVQVGLTSTPMPKLSVSANLRYEDRDDQTPVVTYITAAGNSTHDGANEVRSYRTTLGRLDVGYQLPDGYRAVAGLDHEIKDRSASPVRVVSQRERTEETSARLELRRTMSESLNGAVALLQSRQVGSEFLFTRRLDGSNGSNLIAPLHLADRDRERVRLSGEWTPLETVGVQVVYEESWDTYKTRYDLGLGVREGRGKLMSLDATYTIADEWQVNGFASYSNNATERRSGPGAGASPAAPAAGMPAQVVEAGLRDRSNTLGLGLKGKVRGKLDVGANLQYSRDRSEYGLLSVTGAAVASLPDVRYESTSLRFYGRYPVRQNAGVQLDVVHDRRTIDDWTWANWTYRTADAVNQDGTTVRQDGVQKTNFIGLSGYYKWW